MKTFSLPDGSFYTNTEWFVAEITFVCDKETNEVCENYPCSWQQLIYCDNLKAFTNGNQLLYGSCDEGYNVAYPISGFPPNPGDMVLMRYRGTVDQTYNVFEFFNHGEPTSELALTAIQCSGDVMTATFSDGCVPQ